MKHWLGLAALICFGSIAHGQTQTFDVECDTVTEVTVTVASTTAAATPLFSAAVIQGATSFPNFLTNRRWLEIQNLDVSSNVVCGIDVITSTTPSNWITYVSNLNAGNISRLIQANGGVWHFNLPAFQGQTGYPLIPVCQNQNAAHTSNLSVTQCGSF